MKFLIPKQVTTKEEIEVDIPVPSFWKNQSTSFTEYFAIAKEQMQKMCLSNSPSGNVNFINGYMVDSQISEAITGTEITKEEYKAAKSELYARLRFETEESLSVVTSPEVKYGKEEHLLTSVMNAHFPKS